MRCGCKCFQGTLVNEQYNETHEIFEMLRLILITTSYILTYHQSQCVTCSFTFDYGDSGPSTYGCVLVNQIIESESDLVVINGTHESGYTDQQVTWISSQNSRISFFPNRLIEYFSNVNHVNFDESQMSSFGQPIYCNHLNHISLNRNLLSNIPDGIFASCPLLKMLRLDRNALESIGEHTFSALTNLESLYLQANNLSSVHPNAFRLLDYLATIDLASNNLETLDSSLFVNSYRLQNVILSDNRLTTLPNDFLSNARELILLDLSRNQINRIGLKMFDTAYRSGSLILSHNLIDRLPIFDYVFGLRFLHLDNNKITKTFPNTFKNLADLFLLRLDSNQIDDLQPDTFGEYSSVRYVHLNSNNISVLPPNSFTKTLITELVLSDNQLSRLDASSFAQMSNLIELHVERNLIESIDPQIFVEAPNLGAVNLAGNICADGTFRRNNDLTWPRIGTCSSTSVKVQANVIAIVIISLIKHYFI